MAEMMGLAVLAELRGLPAFPENTLAVLSVLDDPSSDAGLVARRLGQDQGLAGTVLRVANSAFYGMSGRVGSLRDAVTLLGLSAVRSMTVAAAVSSRFLTKGPLRTHLLPVWRHSIRIAATSTTLARRLRMNRDEAFTAGLLHELGKLAMAECFSERYAPVLAGSYENDADLLAHERSALGVDHTEAGALLAELWHFPKFVVDTIRYLPHAGERGDSGMIEVVHVAHAIAREIDSSGPRIADATLLEFASRKRWSAEDIEGCVAESRAADQELSSALGDP